MFVIKSTAISDESKEKVNKVYSSLMSMKKKGKAVCLDESIRIHILDDMYIVDVTKLTEGFEHMINVTLCSLKGASALEYDTATEIKDIYAVPYKYQLYLYREQKPTYVEPKKQKALDDDDMYPLRKYYRAQAELRKHYS